MTNHSLFTKLAFFLLSAQVAFGFAPLNQQHQPSLSQLEAAKKPLEERVSQFVATTAAIVATSPLAALAEEVDDYEYGSVDAPIGIAVVGGLFAILTAAVPVFMQGGEEAFEEMRERDAGNWGTGRSDSLNKRR